MAVALTKYLTQPATPIVADFTGKAHEQANERSRVLMFSVGLNHYRHCYSRCIATHRAYAEKHGYSYRLASQIKPVSITASAWLKIPLIIESLGKGYDWVFFIDADCEIRLHAPPIDTLAADNKCVYMAKGFSGRVNSGVIIVRNSSQALELFKRVYLHCNEELPTADWGENGHLIHFLQGWEQVEILPSSWNNNSNPNLPDYIRHYSAGGPMRTLYRTTPIQRLIKGCYSCLGALFAGRYLPRHKTSQAVEKLYRQIRPRFCLGEGKA